MKTSDFDYQLPPELIAQTPIEPRDSSRLLVINRHSGVIEHRHFAGITDYLLAGDVLVFNDSRVLPARLKGRKVPSGGKVELLLLRRAGVNQWEALIKPGKRVNVGTEIEITDSSETGTLAEITGEGEDGVKIVRFADEAQIFELGEIPLPPYIRAPLTDPERYQTVYARAMGSVAAPTAGLHFTPGLMEKLNKKNIRCLFVTLHVGLDTFLPVREDNPREHHLHKEYGVMSEEVARELSQARADGRRIVAVGTTAVRVLEEAAQRSHLPGIQPFADWVSMFILPGHDFRLVDAMITNFHLPRSTLLMLVTAFGGEDLIKRAYEKAIAERYRFYSFGDAMLIL
ncbi:MAG: tRNA preQ1(34) S-adenosylmethionine ribosyltransferase-isomerase QueA [Chloroflexi bacterium]|nr:tRNA preQ1(34) S-adenosylmethionine ribosyltransferase-isomerase QueA [Chloroflexota bacterium]